MSVINSATSNIQKYLEDERRLAEDTGPAGHRDGEYFRNILRGSDEYLASIISNSRTTLVSSGLGSGRYVHSNYDFLCLWYEL